MLRAVAKDVMHLIKLRLELLQLMLADFIQGVDIYLSCVRDTDDDEVLSSQMVCVALNGWFLFSLSKISVAMHLSLTLQAYNIVDQSFVGLLTFNCSSCKAQFSILNRTPVFSLLV